MATFNSLKDLQRAMSGYAEQHLAQMSTGEEVTGPDQRGPCCGLYALQHVFNFWARNGVPELKNAPVVARKSKQTTNPLGQPLVSLRELAKRNHLTQIGELLSAESLRQVANATGVLDATTISFGTQAEFKLQVTDNLKANCPLILGFDVNCQTGSPTQKQGNAAHWTTLIGYTKDSRGSLSIAHFHWGEYHFDSAAEFYQSNQQLALLFAAPEQWVKGFDPKKKDTVYTEKDSKTAKSLKIQHNPIKGDFTSPDSRKVTGLKGCLVKLKPRTFQQADLELVGVVQQLCERYDKSLHGFFSVFRNASQESLSALKQLRTMLDIQCTLSTKASDLRNMIRHFRKDPKTTAKHTTWGSPAGTTFRKYMNEAFAGKENLLI